MRRGSISYMTHFLQHSIIVIVRLQVLWRESQGHSILKDIYHDIFAASRRHLVSVICCEGLTICALSVDIWIRSFLTLTLGDTSSTPERGGLVDNGCHIDKARRPSLSMSEGVSKVNRIRKETAHTHTLYNQSAADL